MEKLLSRATVLLSSVFLFQLIALGSAQADADFEQRAEAIVEKYRKQNSFQGNVLIVRGDKVEYRRSTGFAVEEHKIKHGSDTRFLVGSIAKQFTAALVLKLQEQGYLKTSERISRYIKVPDAYRGITIHHLLTHTSGLGRNLTETKMLRLSEINPPSLLAKSTFALELFSDIKPGGMFSYSNVGYSILAHICETVTNQSFEGLLQKYVFNPAKMTQSGVYHRSKVIPNMSEGYFFDTKAKLLRRRCCNDSSNFVGSHNVYATIDDLNRWVNALYMGDVIHRFDRNLMLTPHVGIDARRAYGYGWFMNKIDGYRQFYYNGQSIGYLSSMSRLPELSVTIILLSNRHSVPEVFYNDEMRRELVELAVREFGIKRR